MFTITCMLKQMLLIEHMLATYTSCTLCAFCALIMQTAKPVTSQQRPAHLLTNRTSGDILYITVYELSPGNQVSSSIYAFAMIIHMYIMYTAKPVEHFPVVPNELYYKQ